MARVFALVGGPAVGSAGWALGAPFGRFTAFGASTVGLGLGVYLGRRAARHLGG